MVSRSTWVMHNGKRILIQDYRGCAGKELIAAIKENEEFSLRQEVKSGIRVLVDVTGVYGDKESLDFYKDSAKRFRDFFDKRAVVGVTGVQRLFLKVIKSFARISVVPFDTREEALDWLASDDR